LVSVMLVEDDPAMGRVLEKVIGDLPYAQIVGRAADGLEAGHMFRALRPQVVFLDIELPGRSGIEVAREIFDASPWTYIVFATAFTHYRDDAFDVYAFDYLVKPFKITRIRQTMERIKQLLEGRVAGEAAPVPQARGGGRNRKLCFRDGDTFVLANSDEIVFATREDRHCVIHLADRTVRVRKGLTSLERDLGGYPFYRCHKGFIINLEMAREFVPSGCATYEVVMANTSRRPLITWEKVREIHEMWGGGTGRRPGR